MCTLFPLETALRLPPPDDKCLCGVWRFVHAGWGIRTDSVLTLDGSRGRAGC